MCRSALEHESGKRVFVVRGLVFCVKLPWSGFAVRRPATDRSRQRDPVPMGVKVYTANPPGGAVVTNGTVTPCDVVNDYWIWVGEACWYSHVMNGNIRFITAKPAASSTIQRSIVAAVYTSKLKDFALTYHVKYHYAENGAFAGFGSGEIGSDGKAKESAGNNGVTNTQDWRVGSTIGTITHDAVDNLCFAFQWFDNSRTVSNTPCNQ